MGVSPRILLVNDDEDGLFLLEHAVLREFPGATILKSKSGPDALALLGTQPVEAIITDNRMPAMEGVEMVRLIRQRDGNTPILMLTGSEHMKAAALAAGVSLFVASGSWDDIRGRIRELVKGSVSP
jgi:CheY-like chemotaxis protein